ncbi:helicase SNF [Jeotgalibacillus sp. S-D1]|uniref:DEAD/DEAH box helicase n=1 Tax=Jeotgalibacillus sp. S-D1 TaxID=2552189 RepID=UPI001059FCA5|nr:DEAD/DEAH box helicase [Jeotgalibacillus sp. S-D1]TDL30855.1 helicase SNF [Jeotgalibacillus sp. S-D1]
MDIKVTKKSIKEKCGTASFNRGDAFYRADKVKVTQQTDDICEAVVSGKEAFYVTIKREVNQGFSGACSCPKLASYDKDCQHIASVLILIMEQQLRRKGTGLPYKKEGYSASSSDNELTDGFMTLFDNRKNKGSGHQLHFENREKIDAAFILVPMTIGKETNLIGLEMTIEEASVLDIRTFLTHVKKATPYLLSPSFTYDPRMHCFDRESDDVIQQLIQVTHDEKVYLDAAPSLSDYTVSPNLLLIPPSSWESLKQLFIEAPSVTLEYRRKSYGGLQLSDELLPLQFVMTNSETGSKLQINGLQQILQLPVYHGVLVEGKWIELKKEDSSRLHELSQMLHASKTNQIPIAPDQVELFLDKVVPGLKKLGQVQLPGYGDDRFKKAPLLAKLYLDRVKSRLLASLEFCYGDSIINPLDDSKFMANSIHVREKEKEAEIMQLMDDSSFTKTDSGFYLHNEELEYNFLYHIVPKLQPLVQIYATTAIRNRIFRENNGPKISVKIKKERTNWLEFKFEMDGVPESQIRQLLAAIEEKRKYYRLRNGSLFSLETREIQEIKRFLNAVPVQPENLEQGFEVPVVQGLRLLDSVDDRDAFKLEESFRQFLDQLQHPSQLQFEVPESLEDVLRDYQKDGFKWMKMLASNGFGGILADDMGLGKTLQSITFLLSELTNIRQNKQTALIVCPSSVMYNWLRECIHFAPEIEAVVLDGSASERSDLQKDLSAIDVIITSYPLLRRDIKWYEAQSFHTVIFDEAQAFKNPVTQTARAVKKLEAVHRFALTGTPIENSIEELWSIFHVVFPELFQGLKEYSHLSRKTIARRVRPFLLRRMKEDVLAEIPEKLESIESLELLPDQKKLYAAYLAKLRHDTLKHLDKDTLRKNRIKILAGLTRLRQICCHPELFVEGYKGRSAKFEQLLQILEESRTSGRRVLIFSQFTKMLGLIGKELTVQGHPFFYLDGQTPAEERLEICNRFNGGERELFLISLKAGGTGLNLTGADTVILYDTWWNPAVEEQAADRAHRMGQKNAVQVIKLIARGTIEEKMNELQDKKRHLIEELIESDKKSSSSLTEEDIREILMI